MVGMGVAVPVRQNHIRPEGPEQFRESRALLSPSARFTVDLIRENGLGTEQLGGGASFGRPNPSGDGVIASSDSRLTTSQVDDRDTMTVSGQLGDSPPATGFRVVRVGADSDYIEPAAQDGPTQHPFQVPVGPGGPRREDSGNATHKGTSVGSGECRYNTSSLPAGFQKRG